MNNKILRAFIKKEFLHIFRDYRTLIVLFGMPIAQVILFGYAITTELRDAGIAVWDKSSDNKSIELIQNITASSFFIKMADVNSSEQIEREFKKGKVKAVVVIPADFNGKLERREAKIQIITDATDPNTANLISNQLSGIIQKWALSAIPTNCRLP